MSAIIPVDTKNRPEGICGICRNEFTREDRPLTHEGGQNHDGLHKDCLVKWLKISPTCPYDREELNPGTLISRTERIMSRLKPALIATAMTLVVEATCSVSAKLAVLGLVAAVAGGGLGAASVIGTGVVGVATTLAVGGGVAIAAKTAVALVGGGAVVGVGGRWILNRLGVDEARRRCISAGIFIGSLIPGVSATTAAVTAGVIAGVFSQPA